MFWHNYKCALKSLFKNRALVFWTLAFPFILAILFNVAFARLHDYDVFEPFNIAVVKDDAYQKKTIIKEAIKSLSEGDEQLFNTRYVNKKEAEKLLDQEEIEGFVYIDGDNVKVRVKKNGTNQTVLSTAIEQIAQSEKMINDIAMAKIANSAGQAVNIAEIYQNAAKIVSESEPNIKDESRVMNMVVIEFYTLIAMACMQGAMLSVEMTNRCLPNLSSKGKRVAVAPTKKSVMLFSSLMACYTMLFASLIALILFMRFVLGVGFGGSIPLIVLLSLVGGFTAIMMGMFLSIILKTNEGAKNVIVLIVTMVGCLFAGMFGGNKIFFEELLPFINKISPVGLITDGFYSLYYYDDLARYAVNIVSLLVVAAVFFVLSLRSLRRARYDSI